MDIYIVQQRNGMCMVGGMFVVENILTGREVSRLYLSKEDAETHANRLNLAANNKRDDDDEK